MLTPSSRYAGSTVSPTVDPSPLSSDALCKNSFSADPRLEHGHLKAFWIHDIPPRTFQGGDSRPVVEGTRHPLPSHRHPVDHDVSPLHVLVLAQEVYGDGQT